MRHRHVGREPRERGRGVHDVATLDLDRPAVRHFVVVRARHGGAVGGQIEPLGRGAQRLGLEVRRAAYLVSGRARRRVSQRQHRAAREVEHRPLFLIEGADAQHRQAGRPPPLLHAVLTPRDHLGLRAQRVAEANGAAQQQSAVEEIRHHAPGRHCGLPDRHVPNQRRMRKGGARPGDGLRERAVERQPEPVAGDRLVQRGVTVGERQRRSGIERRPDL